MDLEGWKVIITSLPLPCDTFPISRLDAALIEISPRLVVSPSTSKDYFLLAIRKNYDYRMQAQNVNGYKVAMELAMK